MYLSNTTDVASNILDNQKLSKNNYSNDDKFIDFIKTASLDIGTTIIVLLVLYSFYRIFRCSLYYCLMGCNKYCEK